MLSHKYPLPLCVALAAFTQGQPGQGQPGQGQPGQRPPTQRPPLFFRETWRETMETPVTQAFVSNPDLELKLYGPSGSDQRVPSEGGAPPHIFTGMCLQTCALALKRKDAYVDLTGLAKIRWVTKTSGFHLLRPIVKLADGTWLVGDHADGYTFDWHESEFFLSEVRWMKLNIERITPFGGWADNVDLSKVDEIGFTDMMPGGLHGTQRGTQSATAWSDVASIEVYGKPVQRQ
jgi:hypothetical protein